ncbi:MAG: sugar ABC transporter permease [Gammaproteobacteria bacterium]|nr:sugar ABC transporter permease [Gammaproteobacteria bacterium]
MRKHDNRAWWLVLPVVVAVAFSAVIPLMTVVNYSLQDIFDTHHRLFVGFDWYRETLRDPRLISALGRQLLFSALVLVIEIPLGILIAKSIPTRGRSGSLDRGDASNAKRWLVLLAVPLLVPWNVVGTIWQIFARGDIGLLGSFLNRIGFDFNYAQDPVDAWITLLMLDVWHWTSLVTLLTFAGLRSIPEPFYQAAAIDGASSWQVFRYVELPRLKAVLTIAVLLRLMDSLMIYTEPFVVTGGGPGNSTTFLSQYLTTMAVGQFDVGPAAAFSVLYFLIILALCWLFYTAVMRADDE